MTNQTPDLIVACNHIISQIRLLMGNGQSSILVTWHGRSGSGKSTLASLIENELDKELDVALAALPEP